MSKIAKHMSSILRGGAIIFLASIALASSAQAGGNHSENIMFIPAEGAFLNINPPGPTGGGGFAGELFKVNRDTSVGSFTTNIVSGDIIFNVLGMVAMGQTFVTVGPVHGTFDTRRGILYDEHFATLVIVPDATTTAGYDQVVVVYADATILGGTRGFHDACGTGNLYLKMEVDFDQGLPPIVQAGSFMYTLEEPDPVTGECAE